MDGDYQDEFDTGDFEVEPEQAATEMAWAALEHARSAGADEVAIASAAGELQAAGVDPASAVALAAFAFDHSEATDELDALRKISWREGWD